MSEPNPFDEAAKIAEQELTNISRESVEPISAWWLKWYMKAGHKRLGRILVKIAKARIGTGEVNQHGR